MGGLAGAGADTGGGDVASGMHVLICTIYTT